MSKIVLCTGGYDPLHSGHISYFQAAKQLGDILVVGVNSDEWLVRKKGQAFMPLHERTAIIDALSVVDKTIHFDDSDGSAIAAIELVKQLYPTDQIIFANGGDRTQTNIPEMSVRGVEFEFAVGGSDKKNSSSWILAEWKAPKTQRPWGYYRVLHEVSGCKVKELTIDSGQSLSMQKHLNRSEIWLVSEGCCDVHSTTDNGYNLPVKMLQRHDQYVVPVAQWHRISNPYDIPCKVVEIQYGSECVEEDIIRKN